MSRRILGLPGQCVAVWAVVALVVLVAEGSGRSLYVVTASAALCLAVAGSGLAYIYGQAGMLSMGQAGLWGVGAFTAAILAQHGWGFIPCCVAATTASALGGLVLAIPALRVRGHHFLIITFVFTLLLVTVGGNLSITGGSQGLVVVNKPAVFGWAADTPDRMLVLYAVLYGLATAALLAVKAHRLGRLTLLVRENETLAAALGVNVAAMKFLAFAVSGAFAGLGGAMYCYFVQSIAPELFGLTAATNLATIVIIGGSRYTLGPLVGALITQFIPLLLGFSPNVSSGVNGALLVVIILVAGSGVAGVVARLGRLRIAGRSVLVPRSES